MPDSLPPLNVWIIDPANITPFYALTLASAVADRGHQVRYLTSAFTYDRDLQPPKNVTVEEIYFRRFAGLQRKEGSLARKLTRAASYPFGHRAVLAKARREHPDIMHLQWSRVPYFDRKLVQRAHQLGIPFVQTVHDVEPLYGSAGAVRALEQSYAASDALIVHTQKNKSELLERYRQVDPNRVHVIAHGPLQADACPEGMTQADARRELNLPADAPIALHFGNLKPYKGIDLLAAAFQDVVKHCPTGMLLLAGRPDKPGDVPSFAGIEANVRTQLGFIPNKDVWKYYLACDVAVLPYRKITQSGVLLSSMAYGKASIVTAVGGLPEVVLPGKTGWITPPEDPPALARAILDAFADRPRTAQMGADARTDVLTRFSWSAIAEQTEQLYRSLRRT